MAEQGQIATENLYCKELNIPEGNIIAIVPLS